MLLIMIVGESGQMGEQLKQLDKQAYRDGSPLDEVLMNYKRVTDYTRYFLL